MRVESALPTAWLFALALVLGPGRAEALRSNAPVNTSVLPVVVRGESVPQLLGVTPAQLSAFSCREGRPRPILFQMDEFNAEGRAVSTDAGSAVARDDDPGKFDRNDELVFMLRDFGEACPAEVIARVNGRLVRIAAAAGYLKEPAYAYILAGERGHLPAESYVRYDPARQMATTSAYSMGFMKKQPVVFNHLSYANLQGRGQENLIDRLKVRFQVNAVKGMVKLKITEDDIESALDGVRAGPVRVVREHTVLVKTVPGFTIKAFVTYYFYERLIYVGIRFAMPAAAALFVSYLDLSVSIDYVDIRGLSLFTSALPRGALVDGKMIEQERSLALGKEPWYMISGKGLMQIAVVDLDPDLKLTAASLFIDDPQAPNPPESAPGGLPEAGYQFLGWEGLEARWYGFSANIATLDGFPEGGGSGFYRAIHTPLELNATEAK